MATDSTIADLKHLLAEIQQHRQLENSYTHPQNDKDQIVAVEQRDLLDELKQHKPLTVISKKEKPFCIGGEKRHHLYSPNSPSAFSKLQLEFIQSSIAMQMRLRPRLERMQMIRASAQHNQQWKLVQRDVRQWKWANGGISDCRLIYQIEGRLDGIGGWKDLQKEIRESNVHLEPITYDGFYIIKRNC